MEIQERVVEILKRFLDDEEELEINSDTDLIDDIGLNSVNMIVLIGDIEDEFEIEIETSMLLGLSTVGDVVKKLTELFSLEGGVRNE